MVILDTDHMSVLERREQPGVGNVRARLAEVPPSEVVTTVLSYEEQRWGWMAYLARARSMAQQITADGRLLSHLESYRRIPVLGFDEAAATVFQRLRRTRIQMGPMDLRIASTVLSRNLEDFRHIPAIHVEDWITSR